MRLSIYIANDCEARLGNYYGNRKEAKNNIKQGRTKNLRPSVRREYRKLVRKI